MGSVNGIALDGARRIEQRFEEFPEEARAKIAARVRALTTRLEVRVRAAVPRGGNSGKLPSISSMISSAFTQSERLIKGRVFVAGGADPSFYGKAAATEYGSHRQISVQRLDARSRIEARILGPKASIAARYTRTTNTTARDYLRGPLDAMASEIHDEIESAIAEATRDE